MRRACPEAGEIIEFVPVIPPIPDVLDSREIRFVQSLNVAECRLSLRETTPIQFGPQLRHSKRPFAERKATLPNRVSEGTSAMAARAAKAAAPVIYSAHTPWRRWLLTDGCGC
jgi:hypothetical protein